MKTKAFILPGNDIALNLAREESLILNCAEDERFFLLWNSELSVVVGRFQCHWREANLAYLAEHKIPIVRRISGGGTVVHGPGNLCWSIIAGNRELNKIENSDLFLRMFTELGLKARRSQRTDLEILDEASSEWKKVSGSAFRQTKNAHLHHGTLLVDFPIKTLKTALVPSFPKIKSPGIKSRSSQVVNLKSLIPELTMDGLQQKILKTAGTSWDSKLLWSLWGQDTQAIKKRAKFFRSQENLLNHGPPVDFSVEMVKKNFLILLRRGKISSWPQKQWATKLNGKTLTELMEIPTSEVSSELLHRFKELYLLNR